jgi:hypothetical protein
MSAAADSSIILNWYYHCNDDFSDLISFGDKVTKDESSGEIVPMPGDILALKRQYLGNPDLLDRRLTEYQTRQ